MAKAYEVQCPSCGHLSRVTEKSIGRKARCRCGFTFVVDVGNTPPSDSTTTTTPPPPQPPAVPQPEVEAMEADEWDAAVEAEAAAAPTYDEPAYGGLPAAGTGDAVHRGGIPADVRELLHPRESVIFAQNPSRSVLMLRMIVPGVIVALPTLALFVGALFNGEVMAAGVFLCMGLPVLALFLAVIYFEWKNKFYVITDQRTIVRQGIFNRAIKIVPNLNIQTISINTGIIDRWLHLNSVQIETSSSGGGMMGILAVFPGFTGGGVVIANVPSGAEVVRCLYRQRR